MVLPVDTEVNPAEGPFAPFAVVDVDDLETTEWGREHLAAMKAAGVQFVTRDEMKFLREWSWGENAHRIDCPKPNCGETMVFEKHPADWPNHPGAPGELRVKVECPKCGTMSYTDGGDETGYVKALTAKITAEVQAEVQKRMADAAAAAGQPAPAVHQIEASDTGSSVERAGGGTSTTA